jgi:uncharacterized membrane protein YfcA
MDADLALILIGLGVGALVGFTGTGGGSLMTPILVLVVGMPPSVAVGTDLVYAAITKSAGALVHLKQKTVDLQAVKWLAFGSVPSALVSTLALAYLLRTHAALTQSVITHVLAGVLILVAGAVLLKPVLRGRIASVSLGRQHTVTILVGVLVGFLVALTSIGGGSVTMIALVLLYSGLKTSELVGTDIVHAALLSLVAASARLMVVTPDLHVAALLLIGSVPGVVLSSRLTVRVPDLFLRFGLAGTLIFVGERLM